MYYERRIASRFVSYFIDAIIIGIVGSILMSLGLGDTYMIANIEVTTLPYWQNMLVLMVYYVGFAVFNEGVSIGKLVTGIRITDVNHNPLPQNMLILRAFIKSILIPIGVISFIILLVRDDKRTIHDLFVGSVVCKQVVPFEYRYKDSEEVQDPATMYTFDENKRNKPITRFDYEEPLEKDKQTTKNRFGGYNNADYTEEETEEEKQKKKKDDYKDPFDDYYN